MKKKLFAAVSVLLLYSCVIIGFGVADNQGYTPKLLTQLGLTGQQQNDNIDEYKGPFIDPTPEPEKPPPRPPVK